MNMTCSNEIKRIHKESHPVLWQKYSAVKGLTPEQQYWFFMYELNTGFEPLNFEQIGKAPDYTFNEVAQWNIHWYNDHTYEIFLSISKDVPYDEE